jgi:DNA polymerase III subunit gamma/tau
MIVQCTGQDSQALSVTGSNRQALKQQTERLKPDTILAGLDILVTARTRLKSTSQGRILLEMALVRLARLDDLVSLSQLAQWAAREAPPPSRPRLEPAASPARLEHAPTASGPPASAPTAAAPEQKKKELAAPDDAPAAASNVLDQETLPNLWAQVISESGFVIGAELRRGEVAISGPNALVLRFPSGYNATLDSNGQARLTALVHKVIGPNVSLRLENGSSPIGPAKSAATPVPASAGSPQVAPAETAEVPGNRLKRQRGEVARLPLVKKAMDVLGAQVMNLDEDFATSSPAAPSAAEPTDSGDQEQD